MTTIGVHAAKTQLSRLIKRVAEGEEVIIVRGNKPVARLVPYEQEAHKRGFGSMKGEVWLDPELFEPLPEEELERWE